MTALRFPLLVACCSLAAATGVRAESLGGPAACADIGGNYIANCGFETGDPPSGWSGFGTLSRDASTPHSGAYSLRVVSDIFPSEQALAYANSNCFAMVPGRAYAYGGWARVLAGTAMVNCGAYVLTYAEPDCLGPFMTADSTGVSFSAPADWQAFGRTVSSLTARSGSIQASCDGGGPDDSFTAGFDDLYFAATVDGVFGNGFE